ncbi:hypothetical protein GCM10010486_79850 [Nonomuraea roseoviolacea subsp. carminata]
MSEPLAACRTDARAVGRTGFGWCRHDGFYKKVVPVKGPAANTARYFGSFAVEFDERDLAVLQDGYHRAASSE